MRKKRTRKRPYFKLESAMTAILRDAFGKMHHGILFDPPLLFSINFYHKMYTFRFQVKYNTFSVLVIYALRILMITWRHWPVMFMLLEEILMRQVFDCCPHPVLLTQLFSKLPLAWENSWHFATPPQKKLQFPLIYMHSNWNLSWLTWSRGG